MISKKRIFNLATYKRPEVIIKMLSSIVDQADVINCAINYDTGDEIYAVALVKTIESVFGKGTINAFLRDNKQLGDCAKFEMIDESDGYFFTVDDDLLYPRDYAEKMIRKYEDLQRQCIVALHGRVFKSWPIESYYNSEFTKYRVLGTVEKDVRVEFAGTCTTMWHTDLLKFDVGEISAINMGDIWLSYFAKRHNIPIVVMAHPATWIDYLLKPDDDTIFVRYKEEHSFQTALANSIYG